MANRAQLFLFASTYYLLLSIILSISSASDMSTNGALLFFIANGSSLSIISSHFLSLAMGSVPLSAISSYILSLVVSGDSLSIVLYCFLSFITFDNFLSTFSSYFLFFVASDNLLSIISGSGFLSLILFAGSWVLFLSSTLSYTHHFSLLFFLLFYSFLPSLPLPLTYNPTLFLGTRLFDSSIIT